MKLSEAIRLGAMLRPQCTNGYLFGIVDGGVGSCAIGAAIEAIGQRASEHLYDYEFLLGVNENLFRMIYRRNDGFMPGDRYWSREKIADWLVKSGRDVEIPQRIGLHPETAPASEPQTLVEAKS